MAIKIITAEEEHFETVKYITHTTINEIYPHYYPMGVVDFFHECHNDSNIKQSINAHQIFLLEQDSVFTGTGSIIVNEIYRLYILPQYQGKGFGSMMMNFLENKLFDDYPEISLEASLPAYDFYFNRGYRPVEYFKYTTDSGDFLCYHVMKMRRKSKELCE
jgi:GNAT superfamily N-acetyltransferase